MVKLINYFKDEVNFEGYTLLLPSVSVGNVPQLTVDLLISSLPCEKVGSIWHPAVVPLVGGDPYKDSNEDVCTACEIYANKSLKLAVIQLRSAIEAKLAKKFFADLKTHILQQNFSDVVILTTSFDYELHNITKEKFYYICNFPFDEDKLNNLPTINKVKKYESDVNGRYSVHGSGFAVKLYDMFGEDIKCSVLIKFVSEGDNESDAFRVLEVVCCFVDCLEKKNFSKVKLPSSWKYVYGGPPPVGIY